MTQRLADQVATSTPAAARKIARTLTDAEFTAVDQELSHRAAALGQPGRVSKAHAAFRTAR